VSFFTVSIRAPCRLRAPELPAVGVTEKHCNRLGIHNQSRYLYRDPHNDDAR
jgi:hypothetical protein